MTPSDEGVTAGLELKWQEERICLQLRRNHETVLNTTGNEFLFPSDFQLMTSL